MSSNMAPIIKRLSVSVWAVVFGLLCASGCERGAPDFKEREFLGERESIRSDTAHRESPLLPQGKSSGDIRQLLRTFDILVAANSNPEDLTDWAFKIEAGELSIDQFIDEIVESPGLGLEVAPSLIFGSYLNVHNYYVLPSGYNLMQTEPDKQGRVVNFIREPCSPDKAESVHPWWDMESTILVCPDTHRPKKWTMGVNEHNYRSNMPLACDSQVGSPEKENKSICGCGPNLIRCMPNTERFMEFHSSFKKEVRDTTAYVVSRDMPLDHLFVGNQTYRDFRSEYAYRRRRIGSEKLANVPSVLATLKDWPQGGQWAARPEVSPGEHAGLLTSHQLLTWSPDRRQRQRQIFEVMWCTGRNSFGATTEKVFEISKSANLAFVHDSWQRLAHTELCTNCHARLDYGFQFWFGYPDARASTHYLPELAIKGEGELYNDSIDDPRGKAPLNPKAFAELAVEQPEFASCMSSKVINYVLGDHARAEDRAAVRKAFSSKHSFKEAIRVALGRYAWLWMGNAPSAKPKAVNAEHAGSTADSVTIGEELRSRLDESCGDCHNDDEYKFIDSGKSFGRSFDFRGKTLPRELVVRMTDHAAYGRMPPDKDDLNAAERTELVELLIASLWADKDAREEARGYYLGQMRSLPAHQVDVAIEAIESIAGKETGLDWGLLERAIYPHQSLVTPGFIANLSLEALAACKESGQTSGRELMICLERTIAISRLSRWPE